MSYQDRVVSSEKLAVGWIETRTAKEMELYEDLAEITHQIIEEAFFYKSNYPRENNN